MLAIGSDHAGYALKCEVKKFLDELGVEYRLDRIGAREHVVVHKGDRNAQHGQDFEDQRIHQTWNQQQVQIVIAAEIRPERVLFFSDLSNCHKPSPISYRQYTHCNSTARVFQCKIQRISVTNQRFSMHSRQLSHFFRRLFPRFPALRPRAGNPALSRKKSKPAVKFLLQFARRCCIIEFGCRERVCGCKSMPVAGETIHVNRAKSRRAWCGLEVSPASHRAERISSGKAYAS